jgi:hypothetical protein
MEERSSREVLFELGFKAGVQALMDKIERNHSEGKPITANGELYWLKDSRQHLQDVMDSVGKEVS